MLFSHCRCDDVRDDGGTFGKMDGLEYDDALVDEFNEDGVIEGRHVIGLF